MTSDEVAKHYGPQIEGKTILITGISPNGLGAEVAAALAQQKPKLLILAERSPDKMRQTQEAIVELASDVEIKTLIVDLSSLKQARQAGEEVESWDIALDVLINNAGIMAISERELTEDGYEAHFATNQLGPFAFTTTILPSLRRASSPRIVNVSSWGHHMFPVLFDDLHAEKSYEKFARYGHSKTANILFAVALSQRGLCAVPLHPGVVRTPLLRHLTREDALAMGLIKEDYSVSDEFKLKSLKEGAATRVCPPRLFPGLLETDSFFRQETATLSLRLSQVCKAKSGGVYLDNCQIQSNVEAYAVNPENAERMWQVSEKLVPKALA